MPRRRTANRVGRTSSTQSFSLSLLLLTGDQVRGPSLLWLLLKRLAGAGSFGLNSDQQVFTREELRERRALLNEQRREKAASKKKSAAERAVELKARMILCVAVIVASGVILWWLGGRPSF
eukprot:COSAG03_NODE_2983_length_2310_cov_2.243781_2_plen_121_part_00